MVKKSWKSWAIVGSFLFFGISAKSQAQVGMMEKEIQLPDLQNNNVALSSLKGKIVLVDFWASWCKPCRQSVPGLKKLYSLYHDKGFEIYGVSLDSDKNSWKEAISQDQSSWIHVIDVSGNVANQWVVSVIPTTFLLDREGKIIGIDEEPKSLQKILSKIL